MNYQISRNGQIYGPYTLDDLKRYLVTGNVLLNDLAKNEEMTDWVPVGQIVGQQGPGVLPTVPPAQGASGYQPVIGGVATGAGYAPNYGGTSSFGAGVNPGVSAGAYQDAPNLHWALVMLFTILTCGVFIVVWNLIVTAWLKRVQPNSNAFSIYIVHAVLWVLIFITPGSPMRHVIMPGLHFSHAGFFGGGIFILAWVSKLIGRFSEQMSLEEHFNGPEPLGLVLNPVMTFFFGGLYFQHHLTRINAIKQAARFGQAAAYPY